MIQTFFGYVVSFFSLFAWGALVVAEVTAYALSLAWDTVLAISEPFLWLIGGAIHAAMRSADDMVTRIALRRFAQAFPVVEGMLPYPKYDGGLRKMAAA